MPRRIFLLTLLLLVMSIGIVIGQDQTPRGDEPFGLKLTYTENSLSLIIIPSGQVSLDGFRFIVFRNGASETHYLSDYIDADLSHINAPRCLRLEVFGSQEPISSECEKAGAENKTLDKPSVFWYDFSGRNLLPISIWNHESAMITCSNIEGSICAFSYIPPTFTPTSIVTDTPDVTPPTSISTPSPTLAASTDSCGDIGMVGVRDANSEVVFCIQATEVSEFDFSQYVFAADGYKASGFFSQDDFDDRLALDFPRKNMPRIAVTWKEADDYCHWLGKASAQKTYLPGKEQWEQAAGWNNKGLSYTYPWGSDEPDQTRLNFNNNKSSPTDINSHNPNDLGLYNMAGNVKEWVASDGSHFYVKGGSYKSSPDQVAIAYTEDMGTDSPPLLNMLDIGFRCAGDVPSHPS